MSSGTATIAAVAGAASFAAASAVLAVMGLGVPFVAGALGAAVCAGLVVYAVAAQVLTPPIRPIAPDPGPDPGPADPGPDRIRAMEERAAALRHDLRGVLSPALMMADRLLKNEDPAVRRAGEAVVRSVDRATALLADSKREDEAAAPDEAAGAAQLLR